MYDVDLLVDMGIIAGFIESLIFIFDIMVNILVNKKGGKNIWTI
jgi:hypothetical protein